MCTDKLDSRAAVGPSLHLMVSAFGCLTQTAGCFSLDFNLITRLFKVEASQHGKRLSPSVQTFKIIFDINFDLRDIPGWLDQDPAAGPGSVPVHGDSLQGHVPRPLTDRQGGGGPSALLWVWNRKFGSLPASNPFLFTLSVCTRLTDLYRRTFLLLLLKAFPHSPTSKLLNCPFNAQLFQMF